MDQIELECPKCKTLLNLDSGFAGGVCRCSNCGTLMTVPSDPSNEKAEEVIGRRRPQRPGSPEGSKRSSRPDTPDAVHGAPRSSKRDRPEDNVAPEGQMVVDPSANSDGDAPDVTESETESFEPIEKPRPSRRSGSKSRSSKSKRGGTRRGRAEPPEEDEGEQILVTKSGKKITVSSTRNIPTAKKSKKMLIRAITAVIFISVLLVIIGISVAAIALLASSDTDQQIAIEQQLAFDVQNFSYDRSANPVLMDKPNAMGFPMRGRTMIVIIVSQESKPYLPFVAKALGAGLAKPDARGRFDIGLVNSQGMTRYNGGMRSLENADAASITSFVNGAQVTPGPINLTKAMDEVVAEKPVQIIVIGSQRLADLGGVEAFDAQLQTLSDTLKAEDERIIFGLDVMNVDLYDPDWESTARKHVGTYSEQMKFTFDQWDQKP